MLTNICVTHDNILLENNMAEMVDSADNDIAAVVIPVIACKRKHSHPKSVWVGSWIMQGQNWELVQLTQDA